MRKIVLWFALMSAMLAGVIGCSKKQEPTDTQNVEFYVPDAQLTIDTTGRDEPIIGESSPMYAAVDPEDEGLTDLWLIEDGEVLCHQVSTDANFGSPVVAMTSGQHTVTLIGCGNTGQQVVGGVWSADKIGNTYGTTHSMTVQAGMGVQNVIMGRVNYVVQWSSTDVVPNAAYSVDITISGHRNTLLDGLIGGTANPTYTYSPNIVSKRGSPLTISVNGFCEVNGVEETVTTTYTVKNIDGEVLYTHSVDVPVLSNRKTVVTGNLYGSTKSNISVNADWLPDYDVAL